MKKLNLKGRNFIRLGGIFRKVYAYIDLNTDTNYVADSLFYKRQIPIKFKDEMARDEDKYRIVFCSINKKYQKDFEEALHELKNKMLLLGHNDYEEFCYNLMNLLEGESE